MKKLVTRLAGIVLLVVVGAAAYVIAVVHFSGSAIPPLEGELSVPGIQSEVRITRDASGIPHIEAANPSDLYFAQGFAHAQDRFWQMAVTRQSTQGRLSEWFGSMTVNHDRLQRMWGWQHLAEKAYGGLGSEEQALLDAYADGVNAWLESEYYRRPPEMRILHVHPEPWQATDSFVVAYSIHSFLAEMGSEFRNARKAFLDTSSYAPEILDRSMQLAPPIIPSAIEERVEQPTAPVKERAYSNNWTVSGAHTASGQPMMASDPQLRIALPNTWHVQAHNMKGRLIAGASFPGIPGIAVGHNSSVAWGITNGQIDVLDYVYIEQHPEDPTRYRRGPGREWQTYLEHTETIRVRFGSDMTERVRKTDKGMVSPEDFPSTLVGDQENTYLEVRAIATDVPGKGPAAFIKLNQSNTVEEAIDAIGGITAIAMNFSLADTEGNIGYVVSGRIALRDEQHATTVGFHPDDDNDWDIAPFDENPRVINPASGRIVSANQQITDASYPYYLSDTWASPYRARRIHELLDLKSVHDEASFRSMQSDTLSPVARDFTPLMLAVEPANEQDQALVNTLQDWDYRFDLDASAPVIWATWVSLLNEKVLRDDLSTTSLLTYGTLYLPLKRALTGEKPEWCDDVTTSEVEDCAEMLSTTLSQTRQLLETSFGVEQAAWQWGEVANFQATHQGLGLLPLIGGRFNRAFPLPGGPESLFVNELLLEEAPTFRTPIFNSSFQAIFDLSDLERSLFMFSGGSSGHFQSPNYNDMTERWISAERFELGKTASPPRSVFTLSPRD